MASRVSRSSPSAIQARANAPFTSPRRPAATSALHWESSSMRRAVHPARVPVHDERRALPGASSWAPGPSERTSASEALRAGSGAEAAETSPPTRPVGRRRATPVPNGGPGYGLEQQRFRHGYPKLSAPPSEASASAEKESVSTSQLELEPESPLVPCAACFFCRASSSGVRLPRPWPPWAAARRLPQLRRRPRWLPRTGASECPGSPTEPTEREPPAGSGSWRGRGASQSVRAG